MKISRRDLLCIVEKINGARKNDSGPENIILHYDDLKEDYTRTEIDYMLQDILCFEEHALDYSIASIDPGKGECLYHIGITDYFDKYRAALIKENYLVKLKTEKGVFPITLPSDTTWPKITITFLDEHTVAINVGRKKYKRNYKDMGFLNTRTMLPDKQWELLKVFSKYKDGRITWKTHEASYKLKKRKQLLSDTLRYFFQIDEDPFYPYRQEKGYKIKMKLIPYD